MTQDEARALLRDRNLSFISGKTGLHVNTLYRFMRGQRMQPAGFQVLLGYLKNTSFRGDESEDIELRKIAEERSGQLGVVIAIDDL